MADFKQQDNPSRARIISDFISLNGHLEFPSSCSHLHQKEVKESI